uniref:NifU_N domain-containing protein n=1 Tax=Macrostomum lignano TaxID=282301 RepID=A0A1I8F6G4_9PLAT
MSSALLRTLSLAVTASALTQVATAAYHKNVLDHYENPQRGLAGQGQQAGRHRPGRGSACGDVMKLQIELTIMGALLTAKFKTFRLRLRHRQQQPSHRVGQGQVCGRGLRIRNSEIAKELRTAASQSCTAPCWPKTPSRAALKDFKVKNADEAGVMEK